MFFSSVVLFVPRLDAPERFGSQPYLLVPGPGDVDELAVDGRGWKYFGSGLPFESVNSWQSRLDPTTVPLTFTSEPLAWLWKAAWCWPIHMGRRDMSSVRSLECS